MKYRPTIYPFGWLILIFLLIFTASCSNFMVNSYRSLVIAANIYEVGMGSINDLYNQGLVSIRVKQTAHSYGVVYHEAYHLTVECLEIYKAAVDSANDFHIKVAREDLEEAQADLEQASDRFLNYVNPILVENGKEVLKQ